MAMHTVNTRELVSSTQSLFDSWTNILGMCDTCVLLAIIDLHNVYLYNQVSSPQSVFAFSQF